MKHFSTSFAVSVVCLALAAWWGYAHGGMAGALTAFGIALILGVMEVSPSFDNAVVNASVLKHWDAFSQAGKSAFFLIANRISPEIASRLVFTIL